MSKFKKLSAAGAAKILLSLKNPIVVMHARPDGDTMGTASALIKILRRLGTEAEYAVSDTPSDRLAFLMNGEKRAKSLDGHEIIAVDVASPMQLGSLVNYKDKVVLTIDHHRVNTPFSDNLTLPDASSAAEALFSVLRVLIKMGKCALDKEIAYPLYAAVSSDTGGFVFSSATPKTYRLAARLMETGIDFSDINHRLFHSKSRGQLRAEGFISSKIETELDGMLAYATLSKADRSALGLTSEHFETAIDIIRSLSLAKIALFVRENDDGSIKASLRSTGFNVAEVAEQFGGGGHIRAAGCNIEARDALEAASIIIEKIKEQI